MLRMCVYMHSRFVENHPIRVLEDGPLISEVVLSQYVETLVALRDSGDHALKVDRTLIDLISKLKADCPEIQKYLHVSQYDSLIDIGRMCLATFTLLMPIKRLPNT
jgi:hypothetical protein